MDGRVPSGVVALALVTACSAPAAVQPAAAAEVDAGDARDALPTFGRFRVLDEPAPLLAVHAALLPTGQVLYFGGSQFEPGLVYGTSSFALWDPATERSTRIAGPEEPDLFCSGHTHLADGRLLVVGGTERYFGLWGADHLGEGHFAGTDETVIFDPATGAFSFGPRMARGRWYPSVTRGVGAQGVVVLGGHPDGADLAHVNDDVEITDALAEAPFVDAATYAPFTYYPRAHVVGGGEIFVASPNGALRNESLVFRDGEVAFEDRGDARFTEYPFYGYAASSVLLPYAESSWAKGTVLFVGAVTPILKDVDAPELWVPTSRRPRPADSEHPHLRNNGHATILPTGEIFVSGGVEVPRDDGHHGSPDTSQYDAEIYRPAIDHWYRGPRAAVSRNYHSTALLLPDGRVWTAGGNKRANYSDTGQPGGDGRELRIELFEPWYYGHPARPAIAEVRRLAPNDFFVASPAAPQIARVVAIAPGSSTHAFDFDQRMLRARIVERTDEGVRVVFDGDPSARPPGKYMLFVTTPIEDENGSELPSTAAWIDLE